jgi:Domain of unknown function (DUF4956)
MDIFQIDTTALGRLMLCFGLDLISIIVFVVFVYAKFNKNREFPFTYLVFNILIFFSCTVMSSLNIKMGFAFGLFAIFGILRYRTITVPIKEMTYLLGVIVLAVINAMLNTLPEVTEGKTVVTDTMVTGNNFFIIALIDTIIIFSTWLMEMVWFRHHEQYRMVMYEKIELVRHDQMDALKADLKDRLGLEVTDIEIESMDLLRDSSLLKVFYIPNKS